MTTSQIGYEKAKRKASARNLEVYWMTFGVLAEVTGGSKPHTVDLSPGARHKCSCMDWNIRGRSQGFPCKHIQAVEESMSLKNVQGMASTDGLLDEETKALLRRAAAMREASR